MSLRPFVKSPSQPAPEIQFPLVSPAISPAVVPVVLTKAPDRSVQKSATPAEEEPKMSLGRKIAIGGLSVFGAASIIFGGAAAVAASGTLAAGLPILVGAAAIYGAYRLWSDEKDRQASALAFKGDRRAESSHDAHEQHHRGRR